MVSLTDKVFKSFGYQLESLEAYIQANFNWESPESGFANYIFNCFTDKIFCSTENITVANLEPTRLFQAPMLATIGYKIASGGELNENFINLWASGLSRLSNREAFTSDRTSFFYRPAELLGICLGASNCSQVRPDDLAWLKDVLEKGEQKLSDSDLWTYLLGILAANSLSVIWKPRIRLLPEEMTIEELAFTKFICNFHKSIAQILELVQLEEVIDNILLERCITNSITLIDVARASILYCSLKRTVIQIIRSNCKQYWEEGSNSVAAIEFIYSFGERFNRTTWQLQSENDINLLNAIISKYNTNDLITTLSELKTNSEIIIEIINSTIKSQSSIEINNSLIFTGSNLTMNDNRNNVEVQQSFHAPTYGVIGNNEGNQNIFISEQKQTLAEAANEIQQLLKQLELSNPTATEEQKAEFVSMAIVPSRRQKLLSALNAGWKEALKEILDNSYVNVAIAIIEGWKNAEGS